MLTVRSSCKRLVSKKLLITVALFLLVGAALAAQTNYSWVGTGDGTSWYDENNWSPVGVPGGDVADTALINALVTVTNLGTTNLVAGPVTVADVTLDGGATLQLDQQLTVSTNLEIRAGTNLDAAGNRITAGGTWNNAGAFLHNNNEVVFVDAGTVSQVLGNNIFFDFTVNTDGKTIEFENGRSQRIEGALTIQGSAGTANLIRLLSTNPGNQWDIDNAGNAENVGFAFVQDSSVTSNDITAATSRNEANNDTTAPGWDFTPTTLTWDGSAGTNWETPQNWNLGYVPNSTDDAVIDPGANSPELTQATTIRNLTIQNGEVLDQSGFDLIIDGDWDVGSTGGGTHDLSGGALTVNGASITNAGAVRLQGGETVTLTPAFDDTQGTVEHDGGGGYTGLPFGTSYFNLTFTGAGTWNLDAITTVNNNLTITSGTFSTNGQNLSATGNITGAGQLQATASETIATAGNFQPGSFTPSTSTVQFTGANVQTVNGYTFDTVDIQKTGGSVTFAGSITVNTGMSTAGNAYTVNIDGASNVISGNTSFLNTTALRINDAFGDTTQFGGTLTASAPGTVSVAGTIQSTGDMAFGDFSPLSDVTLDSGGGAINVNTAFDGAATHSLTIAAGTAGGATTVSGNVTNLGDTTGPALTVEAGVTGTVQFQGDLTGESGISAPGGTSTLRFDANVTLSNGDTATNIAGAAELGTTTWSSFDGITFGSLLLRGNASLTSNNGDIDIGAITRDGTPRTLNLTAGAGLINLTGQIGTGATALGALTVVSDAGLSLDQDVFAASVTQSAGSGTTSVSGAITTTAAAGVNLSTSDLSIAGTGSVSTGGDPVVYESDTMDLTGTTGAGAGAVTLRPNAVARDIDVGTNTAGTLGLTDGEVDTITTTGQLTIGDAAHTGDIAVSAGVNPLNVGDLRLLTTGTVSGAGAITAVTSLDVSAGTGINLSGGNEATGVTLSNSTAGNVSYDYATVAPTVTGSNAAAGGTLTVAAQAGAGALTVGGAGVSTSNGAVTLIADDMVIGGAVDAGNAQVTLRPEDSTGAIDIGANTGGELGLTDGELDNVTTTDVLTIGQTTHTGAISVTAAVEPNNAASLEVVNRTGGIAIGANLTAGTDLTLTANGGGVATGAITSTGGTLAATGGDLTLTAAEGIGDISTAAPVSVGTVGGVLSATNTTSGDLYLSTGAVTLGGGNPALSQYAGGALRIDSSGNIIIAGDVSTGATGTIILNATGTITEAAPGAGTLTAGTVELGRSGTTTAIGTAAAPVLTASTTLLDARGSTGDVYVGNTGNVNVTLDAGGLVEFSNTGTTTTAAGGITAGAGSTVDVTSSAQLNAGHNITGPGGVTLTVTGGTGVLNQTAGQIGSTGTAITLVADDMALGGTTNAGAGAVTLRPNALTRPVELGATTAGRLSLTDAELDTITASGVLTFGQAAHTGNIRVAGAVNPASATGGITVINRTNGIAVNDVLTSNGGSAPVSLTADGGVGVAGAITTSGGGAGVVASLLTTRSDGGTTLNGTGSDVAQWNFTNTTAGAVTFVNQSGVDITGGSQGANNLTLTANGDISDSGNISANGLAVFSTGATNDITLNSTNTFQDLRFTSAGSYTATVANTTVSGQFEIDQTATSIDVSGATLNDVLVTGDATLSAAAVTGGFLTITGILDAAGFDVTVGGDYTNNGQYTSGANRTTFDDAAGTGAVSISTGGTTATEDFNNVVFDSAVATTFTLAGGNGLTANGSLTIQDASDTLDIGGNTLTVTAAFQNGGRLIRAGTGETAPQDADSGVVEYDGAGGTVEDYGAGNDYNDLVISADQDVAAPIQTNASVSVSAGTLTLNASLTVGTDLTVSGAMSLNADMSVGVDPTHTLTIAPTGSITVNGAQTISLYGNWDNQAGNAAFVPGTGTVDIVAPAPNTVSVVGDTTFYNFRRDTGTGNLIIEFGVLDTFSIAAGGTFEVRGTGPADIETRPIGDFPTGAGEIILTTTAAAPADPVADAWYFDPAATATIVLEFVFIEWSNASVPITLPPDNRLGNGNTNWLTDLPVSSSATEDGDRNGRLDRIRVVLPAAHNSNFSGFEVRVTGYTVTGVGPAVSSDEFLIQLREKPYLDTDARPEWEITQNTTLFDLLTNTRVVVIPAPPATPDDAAQPIVAHTLTYAGAREVFVKLSEPVYEPGGAELDPGNFGLTGLGATTIGSLVPVTPAVTYGGGDAYKEFLLTLDTPVTVDQIVAPGALNLPPGIEDASPSTNGLLDADDQVSITSVAIAPESTPILTPVFARDETIRSPESGGAGLIRDFDGSEFLAPEDITLQAFRNAGLGVPSLWGDSDVSNSLTINGFWLPFELPGLTLGANSGAADFGGSAAAGQLSDHFLPGSNSRIRNETMFEFVFDTGVTIEIGNDQTHPLYNARLATELSTPWYRNVRPWSFELRELFAQRGNVTITSNVINPNQGDRATLNYVLDSASMVRVNVFNVAGDLIDILQSGRQQAGEHSLTWDGTNRQGYPVARGIYFIRVMADGIDEYRKVMVVK